MSDFDQTPFAVYCPRCKMVLASSMHYCSFCGLEFTKAQPYAPTYKLGPTINARTKKDQSPRRRSLVLIYASSAVFLVVVCILSSLYFAGITPLSLFSSRVSSPKVNTSVVPKGTPLFADNFSSDAYGWNLQSSAGNYRVTLGNGMLGLQIEKHSLLWELLPGNRIFSNFKLTVQAVLSQGDQNNGYGIYIRGASNQKTDLATYYRFELYGDGSYAIFKGTSGMSGNSAAI